MSRLYATAQEFTNHPTGLNLKNLIPEGAPALNENELTQLLAFASGFCDRWCYQPLYAHSVTETKARIRPDAYGQIWLQPRQFPFGSLGSASYKQYPTDSWTSVDPTQIQPIVESQTKPADLLIGPGYGVYFAPWYPGMLWQYTYISGYSNMLLVADAAQGATTITVDDTTGVAAGDDLTVYDVSDTFTYETITVTGVSSPTELAVSSLQNAHTAGVRVSEVPEQITIATIELCSLLIKERRYGGSVIMMDGSVQPAGVGSDEFLLGQTYLLPYRRVM